MSFPITMLCHPLSPTRRGVGYVLVYCNHLSHPEHNIIMYICSQQPHPHKLEMKISVADETIKLNLEMNQ